jgi:hypothetical protein
MEALLTQAESGHNYNASGNRYRTSPIGEAACTSLESCLDLKLLEISGDSHN